jgi:sugar phosphate isomerase/epimerase
MRLGNVAWSWLHPEATPSGRQLYEIADNVAALGFECIDLIGSRDAINNYYKPDVVSALRSHIGGLGLDITAFVSSTPDLNHPDMAERRRVLDDFARAVDIAAALGSPHINTTIPYPGGTARKPRGSEADKDTFVMPAGYDFARDWAAFTESVAWCADRAGKAGLKLSLECFAGSICSTPHAWLRLFDDVKAPNLGIQLDTSHLVAQRHDVVTAIYMIPGRVIHVHCKDNDGMTRGNLPPGSGIIDYPEVVKALKANGFDGVLSIEVEFTTSPRRYVKQAREHMLQVLAGEY